MKGLKWKKHLDMKHEFDGASVIPITRLYLANAEYQYRILLHELPSVVVDMNSNPLPAVAFGNLRWKVPTA